LRDEGLGIAADPAVVDEPDGDRVEVVELLAAYLPSRHEAGFLEEAEVLQTPKRVIGSFA
jgi:hypothetical protein